MKQTIIFMTVLALAAGCVDDYTEYNASSGLDAPALRISASGDNQVLEEAVLNNFQTATNAYLTYGAPIEFTVSVVDAPGKIGSITVESSVPEFGTVTVDEASVAALQGQEKGEFRFTFTPSEELPNKLSEDKVFNLIVTVSDVQQNEDGEAASKSTTLTLPTVLGAPCLSDGILPGAYLVIDASGNLDGGEPFTLESLEADFGEQLVVNITRERPGAFELDDATAGIWPLYYSGRAIPELMVDLCESVITDREGANVTAPGSPAARTFTMNGTNNEDGTITINWSYVRDDGTTPENPAQGTYTLKHYSAL